MTGKKQPFEPAGSPMPAVSQAPFFWAFAVLALLGFAGLLGGVFFLVPLFAREGIPPAYPKTQPQTQQPASPVHTEDLEEKMKAAADLQDRGDYAGALNAYARTAGEFPENKQPKERMEMIAAFLRSNAFSMTPAKFSTLRPGLEAAADCHVVSAQMVLGEQLRDIAPAESLKYFKQAARGGQTEAMTQAGLMLSNGRGTSAPDMRLAVEWFEKASAAGDTDAMTALAECLIHGKGIPKNPHRAVELLQAASAFQHPRALNLLGDLYARGVGVSPDFKQAYELFSRSAALGFGDGVANVGALIMRGEGVPANPARAVEIWKGGIRQGFPSCMVNYAKALESGKGVSPDPALARQWYVRAARGGNTEAIEWCREKRVSY